MYCQNCGKSIKSDANFCPFCGQKIVKALYCYKCGKRIDGATNACPFCGTDIYSEKSVQKVLGESVGKIAKVAKNSQIGENIEYCVISLSYFVLNLFPLLVGSCFLTIGQYYNDYFGGVNSRNLDLIAPAYFIGVLLFITYIESMQHFFQLQKKGSYSIPLPALIKVNKVLIYFVYPLVGVRCLTGTFWAIKFWGFDTIIGTASSSMFVSLTLIIFCIYCYLRLKSTVKSNT